MAVVCLGAGWFLFSAMSTKNEAAEARNQAYKELQGIYSSKVFPNEENIARMKQDEKDALKKAGRRVRAHDVMAPHAHTVEEVLAIDFPSDRK